MFFFELLTVSFLGLVLGSFATALSYRLPRDISMVKVGRSHCTSCQAALSLPDLVPFFSWLFLRGRCRHCRAKIGWRYPLIELATLGLCFLFYAVYGLRFETLPIFFLAPVLVSIIDIDFRFKIIPDELNGAILALGVAAFILNAGTSAAPFGFLIDRAQDPALGMVAYLAGSLFLRQVFIWGMGREAIGFGDIKFYAVAGWWLGLSLEAAALFMIVSGFAGVVFAVVWKMKKGEAEFPFGPALVIGFMAALCAYPASFIPS